MLPVPLAANPIDALELFQVYIVLTVFELKLSAETKDPEQTT